MVSAFQRLDAKHPLNTLLADWQVPGLTLWRKWLSEAILHRISHLLTHSAYQIHVHTPDPWLTRKVAELRSRSNRLLESNITCTT